MTSTYEVYPIFLAEALSCSHPFISTNVGSVAQIQGGLVAETVRDFTKKMIMIVNNGDLYASLSHDGNIFAKNNFSQEEKISELERIIMDLEK